MGILWFTLICANLHVMAGKTGNAIGNVVMTLMAILFFVIAATKQKGTNVAIAATVSGFLIWVAGYVGSL